MHRGGDIVTRATGIASRAGDIASRAGGIASRAGEIASRLELRSRAEGAGSRLGRIRRPRWPVLAAALLVVAAVYAGYMSWFRDLGLFRVEHVSVTGLEGKEAPAIRRALREAGTRMTTLHVRKDELERAVDTFPAVRSLSVSTDFPERLRIIVNEYEPIAALVARDGRRAAVSRAHTVLRSVNAQTALPVVEVATIPTSGSVDEATTQRLVDVLAEAPRRLRRLIGRTYLTAKGLRITMRNGPVLYFGSDSRPAAKWAAAARVLSDEASHGAEFIDVRLPERPVAGGFEPEAGSTGPQPGTG
jgi:cell division septal protein FtsQ